MLGRGRLSEAAARRTLTTGLAAIAAATWALAPGAPAAEAACPPEYLVHSPANNYSDAELRRARRSSFQVHRYQVKLKPPVDWERDPHDSRRYRAALHSLSWLDPLFHDYVENDRVTSLRRARDLVLDWIRSNPLSGGATDRTWDDRVTATRGTYLAFALRAGACEHVLGESKHRRLRRAVRLHGKLAASDSRYRPTNHGLFVDTNLILLARAVPAIAEGRGWEVKAKRRFLQTLKGRLIEREGFWLEHSSAYQLAIRREVGFYRQLVGGSDLGAIFDRMTQVAGWLVEPDDELWLLGSSNYQPISPDVQAAADAAAGLRWLRRSGLAMVRDGGSYLGTAATYFNGSHKHSDDLTFDVYEHGLRVVGDSGQYDKDRGPWRTFQESPRAHSTLTVDGGGFERQGDRAYRSGMLARGASDGWYAILARNPLLRREGVDHTRLWLFRPGLGLFVVDRLRSGDRHAYHRFFQLGTQIEAERQGSGAALSAPGWSGSLTDAGPGPGAQISLAKGQRRPSILGFEFPQFRERTPRFTVAMRTEGSDRDHLAVLSLNPLQSLDGKLVRSSSSRTEVELEIGGVDAGTLVVLRDGGSLDVDVVG